PPPSPVVGGIDGEDAAESDSTDLPRTYVEDSSPATFGATVITADGDRLNVLNVSDGSPAHLAGLVAGDEIISINGQLLTETEQFNSYLASHPADPLRIVVMRDGAEQTLIVNGVPHATESSDVRPALGIRFLQANHVILQEVVPGSPAEHA